MANHGIFQWLECFGIGLAATAVLTAAAMTLLLFLLWVRNHEDRLALWFADHPHLLKALQAAWCLWVGACAIFAIFEFGCAILEAM
jgi:hypothetical protein